MRMEWNELDLVQEFSLEGRCSKIKVRSCRITWDSLQVPRVELTLSELQEMAGKQQQHIEAQQQMLVAKEQRLRYLHQGGRLNQGLNQSEAEKLQRLKERVESQEAKLKKIRAMRGQVDYSKLINGNLTAEIDHVSSLFHEKQAELQSAVVRVDQLTQQLEDLRRGHFQLGLLPILPQQGLPTGSQEPSSDQEATPIPGPAALELRKLYQDLQARNRHNLEQSGKVAQNKELLNKRNVHVTVMDKRIGDLRERLHKKRGELSAMKGTTPLSPQTSPHTSGSISGRVAAVFPYVQVPAGGRQEAAYQQSPDPLGKSTLLSHTRSHSEDEGSCVRKPPGQWKVSDLDIVLLPPKETGEGGEMTNTNDASWPIISKIASDWRTNSPEQSNCPSLQFPSGYGTYPSATHPTAGNFSGNSSLPRSIPATMEDHRVGVAKASPSTLLFHSLQQIQQGITVPPTSSQGSTTTYQTSPVPQPLQTDRPDSPPAVAVRPYVPDHPSRPQSPRKGPATMNSSSIYSMYLQHPQAKSYGFTAPCGNRTTVPVYGKPILTTSSMSPSTIPFLQGGGGGRAEDGVDREMARRGGGGGGVGDSVEGQLFPPSVKGIPRPLSPTKLTPVAHAPLRYQSDADLEVLRRRLSNAPRPLKKRSSITEPEGPQGPNIQKLLYQRFNTLAGGIEGGAEIAGETAASAALPISGLLSPQPSPSPASNRQEDQNNNSQRDSSPVLSPASHTKSSPSPPSPAAPVPPKQVKRTNLKKPASERTGHGLRVKFNPLALLLDASLEGEFDLVQRIIYEVENPSTPNDEGITPLHNAVCAGHHHIVKFLLDFGVNINAADSDGWTPLHCAASCNSVHLCKMLVESGAAIFATTISDVETAADKCEEMEDGFTQCSQFLYGVQEKVGIMNKGSVYALWDYTSQQPDELSFTEGDALAVLRRCDDTETEWWWARLSDREGYVPRNVLGLYPRIKPRQRSLA